MESTTGTVPLTITEDRNDVCKFRLWFRSAVSDFFPRTLRGANVSETRVCRFKVLIAEDPNGIDDSHVSNDLPIAPPSTYPHRSCNNMSPFSRLRKKIKEKLSKAGDRRGGQPAGVGSEESNRSSLSLQSNRSDWKHTTSSAAKLFLRTVKEASDVFPPLKSVAGGLCAILDNCEVRSTFVRSIRDAYSSRSKRWSTSR